MSNIASFGEGMVEFAAEAVGGPRSRSLYSIGCGGDTSNFAVAASRLGGRSSFFTRIGADAFGEVLQNLWQDEGVQADQVVVDRDRPTGVYFIVRYDGQSEFIYRRAGSAASALRPEELPQGWVEEASLLHVSGITQAIGSTACMTVFEAIRRARASGGLISYDPNIRLKLWPVDIARAVIRHTIPMCDIFLPNLAEGRLLTGLDSPSDVARQLHHLGAPLVVLKMGSDGAIIANEQGIVTIPATPVRAKDPTGAGDTFDAAFAVATVEGESPQTAATFAAAAAARVVHGLGAVNPIPTRCEIS